MNPIYQLSNDYYVSKFVQNKSDLESKGLKLFKKLRTMAIQVMILRMDNTGENKLLQKTLEQQEFNVNFQYTAASTPQQNGHVER